MLTLLSLALLIQILYYILHDAHYIIFLFIVLSLCLLQFSKDENIFLLIPMLFCHATYKFFPIIPSYEGFRKKKGLGLGLKKGGGKKGGGKKGGKKKGGKKKGGKKKNKKGGKKKRATCKAAFWQAQANQSNARAIQSETRANQLETQAKLSEERALKYFNKTSEITQAIKTENII